MDKNDKNKTMTYTFTVLLCIVLVALYFFPKDSSMTLEERVARLEADCVSRMEFDELRSDVSTLMCWSEAVESVLADHEDRLNDHETRITRLEECVKCGKRKSVASASARKWRPNRKGKSKMVMPIVSSNLLQDGKETSLPVKQEVLEADDEERLAIIRRLQNRHPFYDLRTSPVVKYTTVVEVE